jgi:hypothetical protein
LGISATCLVPRGVKQELISLTAALLIAQIGLPGQYPPGSYPQDQGPGLPFPRRRPKQTSGDSKSNKPELKQFEGWITVIDNDNLKIEAPDHRLIAFRTSATTKKPDGLQAGDYIQVQATEDDRGYFTATSVAKLDKSPKREPAPAAESANDSASTDAAAAQEPEPSSAVVKPPPPVDPEDEGPPTLKRGIPKPRKKPAPKVEEDEPPAPVEVASASAPEPSEAAPPPRQPGNAPSIIERAREAAEAFLTGLPNYVCQQFTTRYQSEGHPANWRAQDVVSAEVVYEDGKERYEKLAINGKPVKGSVEDSGSWSTGEFGTILADLLSPATHADFKFVGEREITNETAMKYDFAVERAYSHWNVSVAAQTVRPAYRGSVWISKKSGRVLRIEMQAVDLPKEFPNDTVESAVDYGWVNLGTDKFLLPTRAEMLACFRGTSMCTRNVVEFRTYKKFTGKSNIIFQ